MLWLNPNIIHGALQTLSNPPSATQTLNKGILRPCSGARPAGGRVLLTVRCQNDQLRVFRGWHGLTCLARRMTKPESAKRAQCVCERDTTTEQRWKEHNDSTMQHKLAKRLYVSSKTMTKKLNDKTDPHILFGFLPLLCSSMKKRSKKHFALSLLQLFFGIFQ